MQGHAESLTFFSFFLEISLFYAGSGRFQAGRRGPARAVRKAPEYKKSPMPWGFHSTRLSWFCYVVLGLRDGRGDAQLNCHFQDQ